MYVTFSLENNVGKRVQKSLQFLKQSMLTVSTVAMRKKKMYQDLFRQLKGSLASSKYKEACK